MTNNQPTNTDFSKVKELVDEYLSELEDPDVTSDRLSDYEPLIFEAVLVAYYGKEIWDKINPILEKL